ncbi:MAG: hypothetical protein DSO02_02915, partial [Hadesarchaea archaeon]
MEGESLVKRFQEAQMCLTPEALQLLEERREEEVERVLEALRGKEFIVTLEMVKKILEPASKFSREGVGEVSHTGFKPLAAEVEDRVEGLRDVTGKSY